MIAVVVVVVVAVVIVVAMMVIIVMTHTPSAIQQIWIHRPTSK